MGIHLKKVELNDPDFVVLEVKITEKLREMDYELLVPEVEMQKGFIRVLVQLFDFYGWSAGTLWEWTRFGSTRFENVDRIAIVGEKFWSRGFATFCKPFTEACWRYYDLAIVEEARKWIYEKSETDY